VMLVKSPETLEGWPGASGGTPQIKLTGYDAIEFPTAFDAIIWNW
jgi:hypothetical protein